MWNIAVWGVGMKHEKILDNINVLIEKASSIRNNLNLYVIASIKQKTATNFDYTNQSVTTSYLSLMDLQEIMSYFQSYGVYTVLYTDIEDYLSDYYKGNLTEKPGLLFETSPKGIGRGKDALIPCLCDIEGIKHLGPTANVNCLCSSKYQWTSILSSHGISVPRSYFFTNHAWISPPPAGEKYILKLNYECASIGLTANSVIVNNGTNLTVKAEHLSKVFSQTVLAQEFVNGYEVEVPMLINSKFAVALPPVGLSYNSVRNLDTTFFNYDTIYNDDYGFYDFRTENEKIANELSACVYKIANILDLNGYIRIDFRVKQNGSYYVIDINNDPCINSHGSFLASLTYLGLPKETIAPLLIGNCMI